MTNELLALEQERTNIERSIAILGQTSTDLSEGTLELLKRVEAIENKLVQGDNQQ